MASNDFFIDTSAFLALKNKKDAHHEHAVKIAEYVVSQTLQKGITTDYILDETYTLIKMRAGSFAAIQFGEEIRSGARLHIMNVDALLQDRAWLLFKKYSDKEFSFTDCTSFAVMKEMKLRNAFAFDKHFTQAGFTLLDYS